ncbi:NAD(P)H-binding protein [Streptomyces sp. NPDC059851]|uniref:NAD(P)H-binding protein n=1 Tax=Streptomyces sp. NPDC059851 TaxID=3346971 RepID=UPI00364E7B51
MILVTGATGTVGREVVRRLPADRAVRIMARDPSRISTAPPTAEVVRGDFTDPTSLTGALRAVSTVFLVTNQLGDDDARFLHAARTAGVRHVVKLSAAAVTDSGAQDLITRWQRRNEELLRGSAMQWTLLRPRSFMSNALSWAASIRSDGVVRALGASSPNACVDPRDIADVAVRALTEEGHAGRVHTLTGPQAITAVQQTAVLAELLGRPLRCEEWDPQQARTALHERYPPPVAQALLDSAHRQRQGAKAQVEAGVPALLGRPAGSFCTWARDHLGAFTGA